MLLLSQSALLAGPVQLLDEPGGGSFRLGAVATASQAALAGGEIRLILDYRDPAHYTCASLKGERARILVVAEGTERVIGTSAPLYRSRPTERLELALQRTPWSIVLYCNRVECARAELPATADSAVGTQVYGQGVNLAEVALQPTDELYFADDFMRTDEQLGGWELLTGRWENNQQGSKSSRSANAFSFRSLGDADALVATGYPFWSDYCAQAAVRCDSDGAVGLAVGIADERNYYRLRWTSVDAPDGGSVRLQRVFDGQVTDLTPPLPGGFRPRVWYKLQLALAGGRLMAWIDRQPLCDVAVQAFGEGRVGLWTDRGQNETAENSGALFDDVVIRSWPIFSDDFRQSSQGRWQPLQGDWKLTSGPTGAVEAPASGTLLSTVADFTDSWFEADVRTASGSVGLVLNGDGRGGGYGLICSATGSQLVKLTAADPQVLASSDQGLSAQQWHRLAIGWDHGLLRCRLDGVPLLDGFDLNHPTGRLGFLTQGTVEAAFDNVTVQLRPTYFDLPPQLPSDFVNDEYMTTWAAPGAAWIEVAGSPARWHKGFFFGDRAVSFRIPGFGQQTGAAEVMLGAATAGDASQSLRLRVVLDGGQKLKLALLHGERTVAEATPQVDGDEPELTLELRSRFVLVWIDGQNVLSYELPKGDG